MLEAAIAGGIREMPGSRESRQTRGYRIWVKFPVDRSNDENAKPTSQNWYGAKRKRREAKWHKKLLFQKIWDHGCSGIDTGQPWSVRSQ
ncbi:MAG: hypothetical protein WBJ68_14830 [Candidatus Dechloromonas phosphoritropha]